MEAETTAPGPRRVPLPPGAVVRIVRALDAHQRAQDHASAVVRHELVSRGVDAVERPWRLVIDGDDAFLEEVSV